MGKQWYKKAMFWVAVLTLIVAILGFLGTRPTHQSGSAATTGPNSPAVSGDNNKIEINQGAPSPDSKKNEKEAPKPPNDKGKQ